MSDAAAQEFTAEIAASPLQCFKTIIDFESYPRWCSGIEHVRILERDQNGLARVVEFRIDMKFKSVRYVLEYEHHKPEELTWRSVDGDVESITGSYRFHKVEPGLTAATCRQAVEIGFWVPGPVRKMAERAALQQSVLEFKREVERRLASRGGRSRRSRSL